MTGRRERWYVFGVTRTGRQASAMANSPPSEEDVFATLDEIRRALAGIPDDAQKEIAIRKAQANGRVEAPSAFEQQQLDRLEGLEQLGASIPLFFQLWKKVLAREPVSQVEIDQLSFDEQQVLYPILFRYHFYRHLHQAPTSPVADVAYAINLLWLDKPRGPRLTSEEFSARCIPAIRSWRRGNSCNINFWYHGRLTDEKAIRAAEAQLQPDRPGAIAFRDLSEIDLSSIGMRAEFFTHPHIYHYLKIDTAKALVLDHTLRVRKEVRYGVYVDLDPAGALPRDQLFDGQTLRVLNRSGFIVALPGPGGPEDGYENQLIILDRDRADTLGHHRDLLRQAVWYHLARLDGCLAQGRQPDLATRKSIIQGVYTIYLQLANREGIERLQLEHKASGEGPEAWREKCERFKAGAARPPAKPVSFPPTTYTWN